MKTLFVLFISAIFFIKLIRAQDCPNNIEEFCSIHGDCPSGSALMVGEFSIPFSAFNGICFGNFQSRGGDIQGRLAVQNNVDASSFSIGSLLTGDQGLPYSLISGGNVNWATGSISPESEGIYVGGTFTGAADIGARQTGGPCTTQGCLESEFTDAKAYYTTVSTIMNNLPANTFIDNLGNLNCTSETQQINILDVNDTETWESLQLGSQVSGCNLDAILVINIRGDFQVNFTGSGIWQIRDVIYNIIGTRSVVISTQVDGSILAPQSTLEQTGGVVNGYVIAGGCSVVQFNLPCVNLEIPGESVPSQNTQESGVSGSQSGSVENTQETEMSNTQETGEMENTQESEQVENTQETQETEMSNTQETGEMENTQESGISNTQGSEMTQESGEMENTQESGEMENTQGSEEMENTQESEMTQETEISNTQGSEEMGNTQEMTSEETGEMENTQEMTSEETQETGEMENTQETEISNTQEMTSEETQGSEEMENTQETEMTQETEISNTQGSEEMENTQEMTLEETQLNTELGTENSQENQETQESGISNTQEMTLEESQMNTQESQESQESSQSTPPVNTQIPSTTGTISFACGLPLFESGAQCEGFSFVLNNSSFSFQNFDVLIFGNLTGNTGDIEGSVAVLENVQLGEGFSIGDKLQNAQYSLISGGSVNWVSGALLPSGSTLYSGGDLNAPVEIQSARLGESCATPGCLSDLFSGALRCYTQISENLANRTLNTEITIENSRALIRCQSLSESNYVLNIQSTLLDQVNFFEFENCNEEASWVVNILGSDTVTFRAASFAGSIPARPNNIVFNILGTRTVLVENAVLGSILAPTSSVVQTGGVIIGKVIAQNLQVTQVSKISCLSSSAQVRSSPRDNMKHNTNSALAVVPSIAILLASYFM